MKKVRILSGLLVVMMVLSMTTSVFATDKVVLSDVPFDYMENLQTKSLDSYAKLSTPEKKLVYSIPEGVAKGLTTEALLETILNNEYLIDLFAYDDFIMAVKSREVQFRIIEFLEREDSITVLESYILKYEKMVSENYSADTNIKLRFMKKILNNSYYLLNDVETPQSRIAQPGLIVTKGGTEITCIVNADWSNSEISQAEAEEEYEEYLETYGFSEEDDVVAGITPRYNCHSYAWYSNNYNTNNVWLEGEQKLQIFIGESREDMDSPQIGYTKVVYYNLWGKISHSARVYSLNSDGSVNKVISKWGVNALFIHDIEDCPYRYPILNRDVGYFNY